MGSFFMPKLTWPIPEQDRYKSTMTMLDSPNPVEQAFNALIRMFKNDKPQTNASTQQASIPMPTATPTARPTQAPTPTPTQAMYRHPRWEENKQAYPKEYQELTSGVKQASDNPLVRQLLMDIALIESGGRPIDQHGGPAQGYFQFEPDTLRGLKSNINPYSATESAGLAGDLIQGRQLSRWGVPGGTWGSLDASRRDVKDRLTTYYTPDELNQFLSTNYQIQ